MSRKDDPKLQRLLASCGGTVQLGPGCARLETQAPVLGAVIPGLTVRTDQQLYSTPAFLASLGKALGVEADLYLTPGRQLVSSGALAAAGPRPRLAVVRVEYGAACILEMVRLDVPLIDLLLQGKVVCVRTRERMEYSAADLGDEAHAALSAPQCLRSMVGDVWSPVDAGHSALLAEAASMGRGRASRRDVGRYAGVGGAYVEIVVDPPSPLYEEEVKGVGPDPRVGRPLTVGPLPTRFAAAAHAPIQRAAASVLISALPPKVRAKRFRSENEVEAARAACAGTAMRVYRFQLPVGFATAVLTYTDALNHALGAPLLLERRGETYDLSRTMHETLSGPVRVYADVDVGRDVGDWDRYEDRCVRLLMAAVGAPDDAREWAVVTRHCRKGKSSAHIVLPTIVYERAEDLLDKLKASKLTLPGFDMGVYSGTRTLRLPLMGKYGKDGERVPGSLVLSPTSGSRAVDFCQREENLFLLGMASALPEFKAPCPVEWRRAAPLPPATEVPRSLAIGFPAHAPPDVRQRYADFLWLLPSVRERWPEAAVRRGSVSFRWSKDRPFLTLTLHRTVTRPPEAARAAMHCLVRAARGRHKGHQNTCVELTITVSKSGNAVLFQMCAACRSPGKRASVPIVGISVGVLQMLLS